jgi:dTDP-4-amino-4,6-dideoxy-D-galactose acyltransferase
MKIEKLDWDSNFFGIQIGKICYSENSNEASTDFINKTKLKGYKLIYFFAEAPIDVAILSVLDLRLFDIKRVYSIKVSKKVNSEPLIGDYEGNVENVFSLAYQSGIYSRFKLDSNFNQNFFYELYKEWAIKSVNKTIANYVPVIIEDNDAEAFGTLKLFNDKAVIGLFAVDFNHRRKGLGVKVMQSIFNYTARYGIDQLEVATQKNNIEACSFYEKLGFKLKSETYIYHLWL